MSHLPRLFAEQGYKVTVETNHKGRQVLEGNPFISEFILYNPTNFTEHSLQEHWRVLSSNYDLFVNLYKSLEYGYIAMEDMPEYYRSSEYRRAKYGEHSYYDMMTWAAGFKELSGIRGELYYKDDEHLKAQEWVFGAKKKRGLGYAVLINLSGSLPHKQFIQAEAVCQYILDTFPNALIITTGDKDCEKLSLNLDPSRLIRKEGKWNFRTVMLMSKYMDLVIGCESGLMVASNLWDTPTIQLLTAANLNNHPKYAKNDYSIQSPAACSPCHKGPYKYIGCPKANGLPICVQFDINQIIMKVKEAYYERHLVTSI